MCLAQGPQRSEAGKARTLCLESSTLPLSHCAPYPGESLPPCCGLWGTLHTGDDPPVGRGWLSRNLKGMAWKTESMQNMDVYKFCMTQHVSLTG